MLDEIREARENKGLSRRALAQLIGIPEQSIVRIEAGRGRVENLILIMAAIDYHVAGLSHGHNFPAQLRNRRIALGLSVKDTAAKAGLAWHTVAALEAGQGTISSLLKLIAAIGRNVRRRAPVRSHWSVARTHGRDSRFTPAEFLDHIYYAFGRIGLDVAGHPDAFVQCDRMFLFDERGEDGLALPWMAETVWCNPPFSSQLKWVRKAHDEVQRGNAKTVIMLVPARTESRFFHDVITVEADVALLRGRIKFITPDARREQTPFGIMLVIFGASSDQLDRLKSRIDATWLPRSSKSDEGSGQVLTIGQILAA
ncbi:helix-turn-helix domain-containing protein [Sphingobium yanoikuyae]|uniref:Helix-turn-helix domain-containing protein n=1 Tax=Sphingobium yanoikuyae TaxID=13690 RepID=A0AA43BF01_SPHYA|nr:DNA N-6-adenine-methyltransferase [Sphingobium yanoikuyae]MDH2135119.1 helix-turn-helix domain-containing protein [Sphingobium yanoikuyae]MDH2153122.1 helix-turn-helix domain-containing protein [Sphingobium yanoikuyae]MDH2170478.1 helix-turn-helix domain-containing protein [Sphingobium yanoikuyae]